MKNLPSFSEFKEYGDLLENADSRLVHELNSLERAEPYHLVNEGQLMNVLKNNLSKFFLGSMSRISMIDQARKIILDLELDIIEKKHEFEKSIENLDARIDGLSNVDDKEMLTSLRKEREAKAKEMETYLKAQNLKIKKSKDVASRLADDNTRRKQYLSAGYAEDEIAIAELEYKLAVERAEDQNKLNQYKEKIKSAKNEAEEKARDINNKTEEDLENKEAGVELLIDPEKEKLKISSRKGKDVIQRKNELAKEIVDLRTELERKLVSFKSKVEKTQDGVGQRYISNVEIKLLEISSSIDAKENLLSLFKKIGKTEERITKVLSKESEFTKILNQINQEISDANNVNSGTKKIIFQLFSSINREGKIDPQMIKNAISKLND
jgi:DNA repair exonuclease SbcCD ATPase subunit